MRVSLRFLGRALLVLFVVLVVMAALTKNMTAAAVITGVVGVIGYAVSLAFRPFRTCWTCDGTGRHPGRVFTYAHRQCPSCAGSGRHRRWGVELFYPGSQTRAENRVSLARNRRGAPR